MAKKTASKPAKRRWTVMVFMGADGVEGNVSLADEAKKDIAEMARVGSGGSLNILVQVHDAGTPRRLHIGKGAPIEVPVDQRKLVNGTRFLMYPAIDEDQCEATISMNYWKASVLGSVKQIFTVNFSDGSSEQFSGCVLHKVISEIIYQPADLESQLEEIAFRKKITECS